MFDISSVKLSTQQLIAKVTASKIASANKYWVKFNMPGGSDEGIALSCEQMTMPTRTFLTTDHTHVGSSFKAPYTTTYQGVGFTFRLSGDLSERKYFETWQGKMANIKANTMKFYDTFVADVYLFQLDSKGNTTYQVTLKEAYPATVGEVAYSYAAANEIAKCTVTMAFRHWTSK